MDLVSGPEGGIGKGLGFLAAQMMYSSADNAKDKREWEAFIKDNFYTSPVEGQGKDLAFKVGGNMLYNIPQFKQGFDLIQRETEAMAGKRNISLTNFVKMLASDDESKLSQEEISLKEKIALFMQVANTYLTVSQGTTIPFSKPFIESAKAEIKNHSIRGIAPELYKDLPDMKPIGEVKLFVPNVNPGTNDDLSDQATDIYSNKIADRYNELSNMQPRKRAAELMNIYNQAKVETLINNGFTQYKDVEDDLGTVYTEDNYNNIVLKNIYENKKNDLIEQNMEALENSSVAGQQAARNYFAIKANVEAMKKLNMRSNINLERYKDKIFREIKDNNGKVIKYEPIER